MFDDLIIMYAWFYCTCAMFLCFLFMCIILRVVHWYDWHLFIKGNSTEDMSTVSERNVTVTMALCMRQRAMI